MNATMRKRIEKAEAMLIRPVPAFIQTLLIGRPPENSGGQAWAEHERAIAQARDAGQHIIVLTPLRPIHEAPPRKG